MNWTFNKLDYWSCLILDFRKMTRIRERSIDGDHGLQVDKISLAYNKQLELGVYLKYDLN